jgi:hypothetical protein
VRNARPGPLAVQPPRHGTMDPELAQAGGELGAWVEADIDPARFDISEDGVDVDVRLADLAGRAITTGRLPGAWLHRRRLVKYTADPTVVVVNRAHDSPVGGGRAPGWEAGRAAAQDADRVTSSIEVSW